MKSQQIIDFKPRFLTQEQLENMLECWRMTRVGTSHWSKDTYTRVQNTLQIYCKAFPDQSHLVNAAYKDLTDYLQFNRQFGLNV